MPSRRRARFRQAAEQGYASAEYELAKCYFEGTGVTKHIGEAVRWARQAAEQGNAAAQYRLGLCFQKGEGVARDDVEAYKWLALASAQDDEHAADIRVDMAKVESLLTPEQVTQAQRLAREFKPAQRTKPASTVPPEGPAQPKPSDSGAGPANPAGGAVPAAGAASGSVNVKADDESSEVFVDGAFVGNPPAQLKLVAGAHVIEVKKPGCKDFRKAITVGAGADLTLRAVLEKQAPGQ